MTSKSWKTWTTRMTLPMIRRTTPMRKVMNSGEVPGMSRQRIRWFTLGIEKATLKALSGKLLSIPYTSKRGHGFVVDEVRPGYVAARHVEKIEKDIVSIDPSGRESRQHVVVFSN